MKASCYPDGKFGTSCFFPSFKYNHMHVITWWACAILLLNTPVRASQSMEQSSEKDNGVKSGEVGEIHDTCSSQKSLLHKLLLQIGLKKETLTVTKSKKAEAVIVIQKGCTELQSLPAKELQLYLKKLTGVTLPIIEDDSACNQNMILVGESRYTREMGVDLGSLEGDAYIIKTFPGRLVLAGHDAALDVSRMDPRFRNYPFKKTIKNGTLNAVYAFLQDYCGIRWFMPGQLGEVIPEKQDMTVTSLNIQGKPYRSYAFNQYSFCNSDWSDKNFIGKSAGVYIFDLMHGWNFLVPPELYDTHPEWFAMKEGKRRNPGGQWGGHMLCTSNREMWDEALKNLELIYSQGFEMVTILQSDGYQRCECPQCEALDNYRDPAGVGVHGCPGDRVWLFHDYLARGIKTTYPDRKVIFPVYGPIVEPPTSNKVSQLSDNVRIRFCAGDYYMPTYRINRWRQYHPAPYDVFVYWFDTEIRNNRPQSYDHVAEELKMFIGYGVDSFWFCGGGRRWEFNAPIYYMVARLLRNPDQDTKAILREFCGGLFGNASEPMTAYFQTMYGGVQRYANEAAKLNSDRINNEPPAGTRDAGVIIPLVDTYLISYPDDVLAACECHLNRARSASDDEMVKKRVDFFADGFQALKLTTQGFKTLKKAEASDWAIADMQQLIQTVNSRNKFVEAFYIKWSKEMPVVDKSVIFGDNGSQLNVPFYLYRNTTNIPDTPSHVAIFLESLGAEGIMNALSSNHEAMLPLCSQVVRDPLRHPVLIIPEPNFNGTPLSNKSQRYIYNNRTEQLRDYVRNGGSLMITHLAVGLNKYGPPPFPEIGYGVSLETSNVVRIAINHDITTGMKMGDCFEHAYGDHVVMKNEAQGTVICTDVEGRPVMIVGRFGKGKVILNGMLTGCSASKENKAPEGIERQLLLNAVNWLKKND